MQRRKRRRLDRAGRPAMRSPGRPPATGRAEQQRFWKAIARGLSSEDAAVSCGVSPPVGGRWFREGGGMPPISLAPRSARYLSFAEREEIAILRAQGAGVRDIARRLRRAPSTISRELRRNAATRSGGLAYRASTAQWHSARRATRPAGGRESPRPAIRSRRTESALGRGHDRVCHRLERQALSRRRPRPVLAVCGRLGRERRQRSPPDHQGAGDGTETTVPGDRPVAPLRPGLHVRERGLLKRFS